MPRVGISVGDVNGVGPEVILKAFSDPLMFELCTPVVFTSSRLLNSLRKSLELEVPVKNMKREGNPFPQAINTQPPEGDEPEVQPGELDNAAGDYAIRSLKAAVEALRKGQVDVLVTAPINKTNIQSEDFKFPGHTDFLAREFGGESLMFMVGEDLRVGLITDHVPVSEVSRSIDADRVRKKIRLMSESLRKDFGLVRPRIAVLGINPHGGDNGTIGDEDERILKPVISELQEKGELVFGPYGADGFFGSRNYRQFDAVLAAYHDQGLVPFKTVSFGKGVNFTAGLEIVRTSPDHGTAFDIAGKGQADEGSFRQAVYVALSVYKNRKVYEEITANPLKRQRR